MLLILTVIISVSAISASEVNVTDSYTMNLVDDTSDVSVPMENTADSSDISVSSDSNVDNDSSKVSLSSEEVLGSENSNTLSTNMESNSILASSNTELTSPTTSIYYKGSFSVTLKDASSKEVANQTVKFVINGKSYSATTNAKGVASVSLSLAPGKYTATASYDGSGDYAAAKTLSTNVTVLATIKSNDVTKYYKGSTQYTATFYTSQGTALANKNVKITVNGKSYTKKTNAKGVVSLAVNLNPGTYKVVATDPVTGYTLTNTFKILSTISASDVSKVYTDSKKFKATFYKSNGKVLANKNIKFKINGKTYTQKTNSKGVASLSMVNLKVGTYKIISYNTDGLTKKNTVKVVKTAKTTLTTKSYEYLTSDSKTLKVTLKNQFGYAPGSGKVIKVTVNGKTYTGKTNGNGVASVKLGSIAKGTYTVKYKFSGNNFYKASSASNKLTVLPSKTPTYTVKSTTTFGAGSGTPFKVALTSGGVALAKRTVTLTVNGQSYTKTTDSNGIVSVPIDLNVGKYTVTYSNKADSKINAKSGSTSITVKERTASTLTWKSGTTFYQGVQSYKVVLLDSNKKAISGQTVKLTVNSKSYSATTASNGYATFSVNVAPGSYTVSYSFAGDNDNAPTTGSAKITVEKKETTGYGYWLYGEDMNSVNLNTLASQGTTDIFLNYYAITKHGQSAVETWIANANKLNIRVHIWMQAFYSSSTGWVNPVKDGKQNTDYFTQKVSEAQKYAKIKGVAGIHLDYLRYPGNAYKTSGGTAAISEFTKQVATAVHNIGSGLIVSAALMPETTSNAYYYGQDYSALSQYLDVVVPMIYKGNYGKTSAWIKTTAKWFVDNSKGAQVWAGITGYVSDKNVTKLSASALKTDAQAALNSKAAGVIIFRYGASNLLDFKSLSDKSDSPSTTGSVTISDIVTAANTLKSTIDSKKSIPTTVSVGGVSYSTPQFLYMMTKAVEYINAGKTSQILPVAAESASNPSGNAKSGNLTKAQYVELASRVSSYISENEQAPNYANSTLGNIKYDSLVDAFARVLAFYKSNSRLPSSVEIDGNAKSDSSTKTISIKNVITGATNLQKYYESNKKLPSTVTAGGITFTLPEFMYVMSQAIYQIGNSNSKDITVISDVKTPGSPTGDSISSQDLTKTNYLKVAKNVASYISSNKQAPNYASSSVGKIIYSEVVDAFSRILEFYGSNSRLPSYVTISYSSGSSTTASGTGLNEKNTVKDLSAYLKSSTNCEVDNDKIKSIVTSITKGLTTDLQKATAIFNYVRDTLSYSFYYNTKYGAVGALNAKKGNCVDHSHLLVAMFRTADLPARYVHGNCKFTSGSTYGHVWAQVLVDGKWYIADATSSKNSLGKVNNWNTNSFTLKGIYSSLSF